MDISLSIMAGLGLRAFLFAVSDAGESNRITLAVLGLWEGAVIHQVSGRSISPSVDHVLAYGLRLAVDFLITKNLQRITMLVLWTALGTVASEIILPHAVLRSALKKQRDKDKERRHRRSRSTPGPAPVVSAPLPPRVRAYKPPDTNETPLILPEEPPPQTSTPVLSYDEPPTPPSFFLHETNISPSPSPKPVYLPTLHSADSSPRDALPVRPRSGLASMFNESPDMDESPPPLPVPIHLPTPPDSAESGNAPSDAEAESHNILGFAPDLAPIPELSSSENNHSDNNNTPQMPVVHTIQPPEDEPTSPALPVPNWFADQAAAPDNEALFLKPFSPTASPAGPPPIPVAIPVRQQSSLWHSNLNDSSRPAVENGEIDVHDQRVNHDSGHETDLDELRTPQAGRAQVNGESDNDYDPDPLQTPRKIGQTNDDQLSPLVLNVRASLPDSEPHSEHEIVPVETSPENNDDNDEYTQMPGSISQNMLLQPPLPATSPLFRPPASSPLFRSPSLAIPLAPAPAPASPVPPSPSTIISDHSDISVLSTRIPTKLYSRADELRKKAREEEKLRGKLDEERRLAENQGRTMDALALKIQIRDMDAAAFKLHEKAARRYFVARNSQTPSHKIDVHGLRPREAFDRIERAIVRASQENRTAVHIIVGKGLHSVNQVPTLKPAVIREMQRLRIPCEINPRNPGQLIITLPKKAPP